MLVIGLTGGIGSGKSTFAARLERLGVAMIDVDAIGRAVIAPGGPGAARVAERFGTLDRAEIAKVVFRDEASRRELESITWPLIEAEIAGRIARLAGKVEVVVLDMAVLPQGLGAGLYDCVITVEAPESLRIARLVGRGLGRDDAVGRMKAQVPEATRLALADVVVINDSDLSALDHAAREALTTLSERGGSDV